MDVLAITDAAREAQDMLRDGSTFEWSTVTLLVFVIYVYAVEIERRRWDIVLARARRSGSWTGQRARQRAVLPRQRPRAAVDGHRRHQLT